MSTHPNTFLVPVDDSLASEEAFIHAVNHSTPDDKLIIYHAIKSEIQLKPDGAFLPDHVVHQRDKLTLQKYVNLCKQNHRHCSFITHEVAPFTPLSHDICKTAKIKKVDSIIIGTHHSDEHSLFRLSSVSEGVFKECTCPVTILEKDFEVKNL